MKRMIRSTGLILLIVGACYAVFWGQAIREGRLLFSAGNAQTEEAIRDQLPCFVRAVRYLEVDIFAPAADEQPVESPRDLALRISRGLYTHFALGVLALLAGAIILAVGLVKRKIPPVHYSIFPLTCLLLG